MRTLKPALVACFTIKNMCCKKIGLLGVHCRTKKTTVGTCHIQKPYP